jgi:hypothetical protein
MRAQAVKQQPDEVSHMAELQAELACIKLVSCSQLPDMQIAIKTLQVIPLSGSLHNNACP